MDFEQEQKFAGPHVIHPELKSAIRIPRRADKHHVLPSSIRAVKNTIMDNMQNMYIFEKYAGYAIDLQK